MLTVAGYGSSQINSLRLLTLLRPVNATSRATCSPVQISHNGLALEVDDADVQGIRGRDEPVPPHRLTVVRKLIFLYIHLQQALAVSRAVHNSNSWL